MPSLKACITYSPWVLGRGADMSQSLHHILVMNHDVRKRKLNLKIWTLNPKS